VTAPTPQAPLLRVEELGVEYRLRGGLFARRQALRALDGVSFNLREGETLGIVGESGCGKSTLGRAILRLVEPAAGRVLWRGGDMAALDAEALRRQRRLMPIVFQDPLAALDPRMTAGAIIGEPLRTFEPQLGSAEFAERVRAAMRRVGLLPQQVNRYPHEFSGGQCQRIGIARAMILGPKLVVCDEPVSALDVSIQAQIVNLLVRLQRESRMALLFISHNLSIVRHVSHRILVLYLGRVVEIGEARALCRTPRHPYTQALIASVPIPDPDRERGKPRVILKGELPSPLDPPSGCAFRTRCPKATALCAAERPTLRAIAEGQSVACHHAGAG
jgi:oligopeptide transport system ATP-binding protein